MEEVLKAAHASARAETEAKLKEAQEQKAVVERRIKQYETREEQRSFRLRHFASRVGWWVSRIAFGALVSLLGLGVVITAVPGLSRIEGLIGRILIAGPLVVVLVMTILNLTLGTTVRSVMRALELRVTATVERFFRSQLDDEP